MNKLGKPLIIIGSVILLVAFNMDVSVESGYGRVNNIGLMADRSKYLLLGALLVIAGLFVNFKNTVKQSAETVSDSGEIKCPFCAELIKKDAKLCKHCKSSIPESSSITQHLTTGLNESIRPVIEDKLGSQGVLNSSISPPTPTIDRSLLNKTYAEEFNSSLGEGQIKSALAGELNKVTKKFNAETLQGSKGKTVVSEAELLNIGDNKWKIKIDYAEESSAWVATGILFCALIISVLADKATLTGMIAVFGPIIIILKIVFSSGVSTSKIKTAVDSFMNSIQATPAMAITAERIQPKNEAASSGLYSLKLVSVGDRSDEVKAIISKALGLGINDTNDLIGTTPCTVISGLPASEITTIKYSLIKAGASVDIENA